MITKAVHKSSEEEKKEEEVKKTLEQHDNIVTQYKELIREQVRPRRHRSQLNTWFVVNVLNVVHFLILLLSDQVNFQFNCVILRMLRSRS